MKIAGQSSYTLWKLEVEKTSVKIFLKEFHPNLRGAEVKNFEATLEESGKLVIDVNGTVDVLTVKQARSLYKRLIRDGYRVSNRTIDAFLKEILHLDIESEM